MAWRWRGLVAVAISAGVAPVACSSNNTPIDTGTGGRAASGAPGSGGVTSSGGAANGGNPGQGGATSSGGAQSGGAAMGGAASGGAQSGGATSSGGAASGGAAMGGSTGGGTTAMGGGGGVAGGSAGGAATLVTPIMRSATSYVLEFGDTYFEVNPQIGARVIDVHLKGETNYLTGPSADATNYGSTFWPSPQAAWTWPPTDNTSITNINDKPYTATTDDSSMTLVGMAASVVKYSVTKKFKADLTKQAIVATYTMIATSSGVMAAPWEITRFHKSGVTFFPTGTTPVVGGSAGSFDLPATTTGAGCTWLTPPTGTITKGQKLNANGTGGWLAHASGDWVVIKQFTDIPSGMSPPAEDEIELYLNESADYMEVEEQGAYAAVPQTPGLDWTVTWYIRHLPSGVTATAGNQQLVDFVKSVVQ